MRKYTVILTKEVEKINREIAAKQAIEILRPAMQAHMEAFDILINHGFTKEADRLLRLHDMLEKLLDKLTWEVNHG